MIPKKKLLIRILAHVYSICPCPFASVHIPRVGQNDPIASFYDFGTVRSNIVRVFDLTCQLP